MIEIKITDPHLLPPEVLRHMADLLLSIKEDKDSKPPILQESPQPAPVEPVIAPEAKKLHWAPIELPEFNPFSTPPLPPSIAEEAAVLPIPGVELDTAGIPWDVRIHSKNKTKNTNGQWKLKREVAPDLVATVTKQLKQTMDAPTVPPIPTVPVKPNVDPVEPGDKFNQFMNIVTKSIGAKKITHEQVMIMLKEFGISSPALVSTRPDLIPNIIAKLNSMVS